VGESSSRTIWAIRPE